MSIVVKAPLKGSEIQALLENYQDDGVSFRMVQKTGFDMEFEVSGPADAEAAVSLAKGLIRGTDYGKALYFSVVKK